MRVFALGTENLRLEAVARAGRRHPRFDLSYFSDGRKIEDNVLPYIEAADVLVLDSNSDPAVVAFLVGHSVSDRRLVFAVGSGDITGGDSVFRVGDLAGLERAFDILKGCDLNRADDRLKEAITQLVKEFRK